MRKNNKLKAFTLVELAVVLLVIGILAGVLIRNYGGFTGGARDARILADLRNVSVMLASYYTKLGTFPTNTYAGAAASWTQDFANELISLGIIANSNELPKHPLGGGNNYYKYYTCDRDPNGNTYSIGSAYILASPLESPTSNQQVYSGSMPDMTISCISATSGQPFGSPKDIECYPDGKNYCFYNY